MLAAGGRSCHPVRGRGGVSSRRQGGRQKNNPATTTLPSAAAASACCTGRIIISACFAQNRSSPCSAAQQQRLPPMMHPNKRLRYAGRGHCGAAVLEAAVAESIHPAVVVAAPVRHWTTTTTTTTPTHIFCSWPCSLKVGHAELTQPAATTSLHGGAHWLLTVPATSPACCCCCGGGGGGRDRLTACASWRHHTWGEGGRRACLPAHSRRA